MIHQASARTVRNVTAIHSVVCAVRTGVRPADLIELQLYLRGGAAAAAAPAMSGAPTAGFAVGLAIATTLGVTPTTVLGKNRRRAGGPEAGTVGIVTDWGTAPVIDNVYFDRRIGGTQLGYPVIFPMERISPLIMSDSGSADAEICVCLTEAHTTGPVFDVVAVYDE